MINIFYEIKKFFNKEIIKRIKRKTFINKLIKKSINYQFSRFIIVGLINTIGSYLLYIFFLLLFNYLVSYFISTVIFIVISSYLNTSFVFKINTNKFSLFIFCILLIMQMIIGALIIRYSVEKLLVPKIFAPFINIFLLTPLKYFISILMKRLIKKSSKN